MTKFFNFSLKLKGGGREGGRCEVLRPCHPPKIWNVHKVTKFQQYSTNHFLTVAKKLPRGKFVPPPKYNLGLKNGVVII